MDAALRELIRVRARGRCEYCHVPPRVETAPFCHDHVIARKHHGEASFANLALSCFWCNVFKGDNLSGVDPDSGEVVRLFNPRSQLWSHHFRWQGAMLIGQTAEGRATIDVLNINAMDRVVIREAFIEEGIEL
jgi:hypothetical protein